MAVMLIVDVLNATCVTALALGSAAAAGILYAGASAVCRMRKDLR